MLACTYGVACTFVPIGTATLREKSAAAAELIDILLARLTHFCVREDKNLEHRIARPERVARARAVVHHDAHASVMIGLMHLVFVGPEAVQQCRCDCERMAGCGHHLAFPLEPESQHARLAGADVDRAFLIDDQRFGLPA